MGWMIRVLGFDSQLGPTQLPIQWIPRSLSLGVKQQGHEADHLPPSSANVKECVELYLHSPQYTFMVWCSVKKQHRDNFTFTFLPLPEIYSLEGHGLIH
jgi:hypothetical protein